MSKSSAIRVKVFDLTVAVRTGAVSRLLNCPKPIKVAWDNRHLVGAINDEYRSIEEQRIALCRKWGRLDEASKDYVFDTTEAAESFKKEYKVLSDQVVDLPGSPVRVSDLRGDMSEADLSVLEAFLAD